MKKNIVFSDDSYMCLYLLEELFGQPSRCFLQTGILAILSCLCRCLITSVEESIAKLLIFDSMIFILVQEHISIKSSITISTFLL